jgi:hypothetical protein
VFLSQKALGPLSRNLSRCIYEENQPDGVTYTHHVWLLLALLLFAGVCAAEPFQWARRNLCKAAGFATIVAFPLCMPRTRALLHAYWMVQVEVAAMLTYVGFFAYLRRPKRAIWNIGPILLHFGIWAVLSDDRFLFDSWPNRILLLGALSGLVRGVCVRLLDEPGGQVRAGMAR